ncbi:MAG: Wzz/FepE/Etk N-terminal domain-containing protein, partial [Bacteroidia bacterium]
MENTFNLIYVLRIIRDYRKFIGIVTLGVGVIAIIYALMNENQYRSEVIIYPTNPERYDLTSLAAPNSNTFVYGGAKEVEKLGNIAKSEKVALATIDSLNLWKEYGIDPKNTGASPKFKVLKEFSGNVNISQAEGGGVLIQAYDKTPQVAADIANTMVFFTNYYNNEIIESTREQLLGAYQKDYDYLYKEYNLYKDSTNLIRAKFNVYSYNPQTEVMLTQLIGASTRFANEKAKLAVFEKSYPAQDTAVINTRARMRGAESQVETIKNSGEINLNDFKKGVDELVHLEQTYFTYGERLRGLRLRMEELTAISDPHRVTVVSFDKANASDKKARPVRWLIVVSSLLIGLFTAVVAAI